MADGDADLASLGAKARQGNLSDGERMQLEAVAPRDEDFVPATLVLYQDAKARKDVRSRRKYLDKLLAQPEHGYNPLFLAERAQVAIIQGDFDTALERLAGVGELVDQTISADDVTDRIGDLESRIVTAETRKTRRSGIH